MLDRLLLGIAVVSLAACSSSGEEPAPEPDARAGEIHGADLWRNGLVLTGAVVIAADANVEIEPGAVITCAEGGTISVAGILRARASASHAKITCGSWKGLVVSAGGRLDLSGVELENGLLGIGTAQGAAESTFSDGAIVRSLKPFVIGEGTKLTVTNVKASAPVKVGGTELSQSDVSGFLVASRLDYDAQSNEGISVKKGGELDLQDSTFHGEGGQDLVSSYGARHVKIAYSTFRGAHCGIHIQPSDSFEIDHVTSESNTYGMTIYGSGNGPNIVTASNIGGVAAWLDFQGENGAITFDGVYTTGREIILGGPVPPTMKNKAAQPIADAKPR